MVQLFDFLCNCHKFIPQHSDRAEIQQNRKPISSVFFFFPLADFLAATLCPSALTWIGCTRALPHSNCSESFPLGHSGNCLHLIPILYTLFAGHLFFSSFEWCPVFQEAHPIGASWEGYLRPKTFKNLQVPNCPSTLMLDC